MREMVEAHVGALVDALLTPLLAFTTVRRASLHSATCNELILKCVNMPGILLLSAPFTVILLQKKNLTPFQRINQNQGFLLVAP